MNIIPRRDKWCVYWYPKDNYMPAVQWLCENFESQWGHSEYIGLGHYCFTFHRLDHAEWFALRWSG